MISLVLFLTPVFILYICFQEEVIGPDGQPGYQHVLNLAKALVEARSLNGLSDSKVDMLISLWQRLPDADKQRQVEGKTTTWPSREPPAVRWIYRNFFFSSNICL